MGWLDTARIQRAAVTREPNIGEPPARRPRGVSSVSTFLPLRVAPQGLVPCSRNPLVRPPVWTARGGPKPAPRRKDDDYSMTNFRVTACPVASNFRR